NGDKDLLTVAAEAQAKTGHDIQSFTAWYAPGQAENLEPVDDVMAALIEQHGAVSAGAAYLGKQNGRWCAVPTSFGSTLSPPCARIDLMKQIVGLDVTKMYPAGAPPDKELEAAWTWEFFSQAAEKCHKAGYPFGMPMSTCSDAVQWTGAMFNSYGAQLVDAEGQITVNNDATRIVLEWFKKTAPFFPRQRLLRGRRVQQQSPDLRTKRTDLQCTLRVGGCEAGRTERRRAAVDLPSAKRPKRSTHFG